MKVLTLVSGQRRRVGNACHDAVEVFPVPTRGPILHAQAKHREHNPGTQNARDEGLRADVFAPGLGDHSFVQVIGNDERRGLAQNLEFQIAPTQIFKGARGSPFRIQNPPNQRASKPKFCWGRCQRNRGHASDDPALTRAGHFHSRSEGPPSERNCLQSSSFKGPRLGCDTPLRKLELQRQSRYQAGAW